MKTPQEIQQEFYNELKQLLVKYKAELMLENFGRNYQTDYKIVVDFEYNESLFQDNGSGITPQLIIGTYENGL